MRSRLLLRIAPLVVAAAPVVATGAGSSIAAAAAAPAVAAAAASAAPDASAPAGDTERPSDFPVDWKPASEEWSRVIPGGDCQCADGKEFSFFVREADPTKVLLYFEGGGACWEAVGCAFTSQGSTLYDWTVGPDEDPSLQQGIFDLSNPANPFADYTMIYVPYCTGDVFIGNNVKEYSPDLTVNHKGAVNANAAVSYLAESFPDAAQVVVAGTSAGSIPTPLYAALVGDLLPDASLIALGDGSGAYPDVPALNSLLGGEWGTMNALPAWPELAGMTVDRWSFPGLWINAGTHNPNIVMSRIDFGYDATQAFFTELNGLDASQEVELMDNNEASIEAAGVNQLSYTAPGNQHTVIAGETFYTTEVEGVMLIDWVTGLISGDDVGDVHCVDCGEPAGSSNSGPSNSGPGSS